MCICCMEGNNNKYIFPGITWNPNLNLGMVLVIIRNIPYFKIVVPSTFLWFCSIFNMNILIFIQKLQILIITEFQNIFYFWPQHQRSEQGDANHSQSDLNIKDVNRGMPIILNLTSTSKIWTTGWNSFSNWPQLQRSEQGADNHSQTDLHLKDLYRGLAIILKLTSTAKILTGGWQSFSNWP